MNDYLESRIDYLQGDNDRLREENRKLKEKIRFLEQCLDNKEKVNKSLREENKKLKVERDNVNYKDKFIFKIIATVFLCICIFCMCRVIQMFIVWFSY